MTWRDRSSGSHCASPSNAHKSWRPFLRRILRKGGKVVLPQPSQGERPILGQQRRVPHISNLSGGRNGTSPGGLRFPPPRQVSPPPELKVPRSENPDRGH